LNGFDPNAYKLLAKAIYNREDVSKLAKDSDITWIECKQVSTKTRETWRKKKTSSKTSRVGLGYESSTPLYFKTKKRPHNI